MQCYYGCVYHYSFKVDGHDPAVCQKACCEDPKCLSWTFADPQPLLVSMHASLKMCSLNNGVFSSAQIDVLSYTCVATEAIDFVFLSK